MMATLPVHCPVLDYDLVTRMDHEHAFAVFMTDEDRFDRALLLLGRKSILLTGNRTAMLGEVPLAVMGRCRQDGFVRLLAVDERNKARLLGVFEIPTTALTPPI